jgi:hypothetical protein
MKNTIAYIDPEDKCLYERELQVLKLADHPFLIEFIENFEYKQKKFCIITKLAAGGDLTKLIYQKNEFLGFSEKEALIYLA